MPTPAPFIRLGPLRELLTHTRYLFTLRSDGGVYRSLLLFRLSSGEGAAPPSLYVMEAACPHLGADLSHADIEDGGLDAVVVCPWHKYDFNLRTGVSETGLKACIYAVEIRTGKDGAEEVWVEEPVVDGQNHEVIELRPVSEDFADPPPRRPSCPNPAAKGLDLLVPSSDTDQTAGTESPLVSGKESVVPETQPPPGTLIEWAVLILNTADPDLKVQRTRHAVELFRTGKLRSVGNNNKSGKGKVAPEPPDVPPRQAELQTVAPSQVGKRGKAGSLKSRIAMLHALANIEQWAIDLAWDIIARFGPSNPDLPLQFFSDFTKVALDEAKHFSLLSARLAELSSFYGAHTVHSGLWSSAMATSTSLAARLAIIHLVHEARGLDVNPGTIARFRSAGDTASARVLETIHLDEVTHVAAGHRWFTWLCAREGCAPVERFRAEVREHFAGRLKGPFNEADRRRAGLTREFYENLEGEAAWADHARSTGSGGAGASEKKT